MTGDTDTTGGLATVEIPPHEFREFSVSDKGDYTQLTLSDNLESIRVTVILPEQTKQQLVEELQE